MLNPKAERNRLISIRVLEGESPAEIGRLYRIHRSGVRDIVQRTCEEADPMLYAALCGPDGSEPGLEALRAAELFAAKIGQRLEFAIRQGNLFEDEDHETQDRRQARA